MMLWTVFYMGACYPEGGGDSYSTICVDEMSGPHDISEARKKASKYGTEIIAMIPGWHMDKSYLFSRKHENGMSPVTMYQPSGKTSAKF